MNVMRITNNLIESMRTRKGGFTSASLRILGVSWPPKKGWKRNIIGNDASPELIQFINNRNSPPENLHLIWNDNEVKLNETERMKELIRKAIITRHNSLLNKNASVSHNKIYHNPRHNNNFQHSHNKPRIHSDDDPN